VRTCALNNGSCTYGNWGDPTGLRSERRRSGAGGLQDDARDAGDLRAHGL